MPSPIISLYPEIKDTRNGSDLPIDFFYENIKSGTWQDAVIPARVALSKTSDKKERGAIKSKLAYVTLSGKFSHRSNSGLSEHSERIGIDFDGIDPNIVKAKLGRDKYTEAVFESCSGTGACGVFKIDPTRHEDAFNGLCAYLFETYGLIADQNCKDVSRPRFVSFDPDIYINIHSIVFKKYPKGDRPGPKSKKVPESVVFIRSEFDDIIQQIEEQKIDLTVGYHEWLRIGFALSDKFDEAGRDIFHIVSQQGQSYNQSSCDRQFDSCLSAKNSGITIATFYYICKQHNIRTASERVRVISQKASANRKAGGEVESVIKNICEYVDNDEPLVRDIVSQIFLNDIQVDDVSDIEIGQIWVSNAGLRRNKITGLCVTINGKELDEKETANVELKLRVALPKLKDSDINRLLKSDAIPEFHPLFEFFQKYESRNPQGVIDAMSATIETTTGEGTDFVQRMFKKWIVGAIANLYDNPTHGYSPLMLILCGEKHGTGKSFFFDKLLPDELKEYSAKKDFSMLGGDSFKRDMEIAITRKWLVWDDEMGGKSKRDHRIIKAMLAAPSTDTRAAYGRNDKSRKRIAFFGGTSNDLNVLPDHGQQRRLIPIEVTGPGDQATRDSINRVYLFMEAFHLYHSGFDYRVLGTDIKFLNEHTEDYQDPAVMEMMFPLRIEPLPGVTEENKKDCNNFSRMGEIVDVLSKTWPTLNWNSTAVGKIMKRIGVLQRKIKISGTNSNEVVYFVKVKSVDYEIYKRVGFAMTTTGNT